jgi:hypothetical protein
MGRLLKTTMVWSMVIVMTFDVAAAGRWTSRLCCRVACCDPCEPVVVRDCCGRVIVDCTGGKAADESLAPAPTPADDPINPPAPKPDPEVTPKKPPAPKKDPPKKVAPKKDPPKKAPAPKAKVDPEDSATKAPPAAAPKKDPPKKAAPKKDPPKKDPPKKDPPKKAAPAPAKKAPAAKKDPFDDPFGAPKKAAPAKKAPAKKAPAAKKDPFDDPFGAAPKASPAKLATIDSAFDQAAVADVKKTAPAAPAKQVNNDLDDMFDTPALKNSAVLTPAPSRDVAPVMVLVKITLPSADRPLPVQLGALAPMRTWSDNTGKYKINGRLFLIMDGNVKLLKENGRFTTVPIRRLSEDDLRYVHEQAAAAGRVLASNF